MADYRYELWLRRKRVFDEVDLSNITVINGVQISVAYPHVHAVVVTKGSHCGVDLSLSDALHVEDLCDVADHLVKALELQLFDPQLGRTVTIAEDRHAIITCAQRNERIAKGLGTSSAQGTPRVVSHASLWVAIFALVGVVLLLGRAVRCLF